MTKIYKKIPKLYVIRCYDNVETFIKIGITEYDVKYRFCKLPYQYDLLYVVLMSRTNVKMLEALIHKQLFKHSYTPCKYFSGYTECFNDMSNEDLKRVVLENKKLFPKDKFNRRKKKYKKRKA